MRKITVAFIFAALVVLPAPQTRAQTTTATPAQAATKQDRLMGEVTAADAATGRLTLKTDAGETAFAGVDDKTLFRRVAPGSASMENAEKITRADVALGDRVLVLLRPEGVGAPARQVIVMSRAALGERSERDREEARRRRLNGRVTAIDAKKNELTVTARRPDGPTEIVVSISPNARVRRFAPDSLRPEDAIASTFAELKVGDQLRAQGEPSADGARFTATEVVAGQVVRVGGTVTEVNAAQGMVSVKSDETGKVVTVSLTKNSAIRRVPAEFVEQFGQQRQERQQMTDAEREAQREARRREREAGGQQGQRREGQRRPGGGMGGRNPQQAFENFPVVALSELKKGDAVLVTGTPAADQSSVTAIAVVTGDAEFLRRLARMQGRQSGDPRNMSPGLPGDVIGGGTGNTNREPPR